MLEVMRDRPGYGGRGRNVVDTIRSVERDTLFQVSNKVLVLRPYRCLVVMTIYSGHWRTRGWWGRDIGCQLGAG